MDDAVVGELLNELGTFSRDPFGFVHWAFPWGMEGTDLAQADGPERWQADQLNRIGDHLQNPDTRHTPCRIAVTSGHGVGKSALVSWANLWAISTFENTKGVVTANTEAQLKTKTWVEISKWMRLFIAKDLFQLTATAIFPRVKSATKEWRIDVVPWSEKNHEAFAGLHNYGKRVIVTFDESSQIPDIIWQTAAGAESDRNTEIIQLRFGNPTQPIGHFRDCFAGGRFAGMWQTTEIDSRSVSITNKRQLNEIVETYGPDDDVTRVRVLGKFPKAAADAFIPMDLAQGAVARELPRGPNPWPVVLGVDIARKGGDATVIFPRQGRDARTRIPKFITNADTLEIVQHILNACDEWDPSTVFIDEGYIGASVLDLLWAKRLARPHFVAVQFGGKPDGVNETEAQGSYANKRAEIWGAMRHWLRTGSLIDRVPGASDTMVLELTGPTFKMMTETKIQLEPKEQMRTRGVASPNASDALACTFALPTFAKASNKTPSEVAQVIDLITARNNVAKDYDPFTPERIHAEGG